MLCAEDVPLPLLADAVGTPFYCYSTATLARHYKVFAAALPKSALIAFSVKANGNLAVLKTLGNLGAGADVVSAGELKKALAAGIPAVPHRVFRRRQDARGNASRAGRRHLPVQCRERAGTGSAERGGAELEAKAPVTMRVNPDVDAKTHAKITTGTAETKFGIPCRAREAYALAANLPGIEIVGVDVHIGSQITELEPFKAAFQRVARTDHGVASRRPSNHRAGSGRRLGRAVSAGQCAAAGSRRLW